MVLVLLAVLVLVLLLVLLVLLLTPPPTRAPLPPRSCCRYSCTYLAATSSEAR